MEQLSKPRFNLKKSRPVFQNDCPILNYNQRCIRTPALHPCQYQLFLFFFNFSNFSGYSQTVVVLICFLMTRDWVHFFMCLLAICTSSLVMSLFKSLAHFLNSVSSCIKFKNYLYMAHTSPSSNACFTNILSQSVASLLTSLIVSFEEQKFSI